MKQSKRNQILFILQYAFLLIIFKFSFIYIFEDVLGIYFFDNFSYLLIACFLTVLILKNLHKDDPNYVIK